MVVPRRTVYNNVVQIGGSEIKSLEKYVHHPLKSRHGTLETERHYPELK